MYLRLFFVQNNTFCSPCPSLTEYNLFKRFIHLNKTETAYGANETAIGTCSLKFFSEESNGK